MDLNFGNILHSCPNLQSLFLQRNPIERVSHYRGVVSYFIPNLTMLDGLPVDQNLAKKITPNVLEDVSSQLKTIQEEIEEEKRLENDIYFTASTSTSFEKKLFNSTTGSLNYSLQTHHQKQAQQPSKITTSSSINNEMLPDNGSELTHGSSIVLAGNMAAAIRRRRNNSDKSNSASHSGSKDFESALDVLDYACKESTPSSSFSLKEGDITESVLGSPSAKNHRQPSSKLTLSNDLKLDLDPEYINSPQVKSTLKPPLSSARNNNNNNPYGYNNANNNNNNFMPGDPDTTLLSATRRPQSAFTGTTLRYAGNANPGSGMNSSNDKVYDNFSPRGSINNSNNVSSSSLMQPSPRQRNSSRPQSAVDNNDVNSVNNDIFNTLKFTFNRPPTAKKSNENTPKGEDSDSEDEKIYRRQSSTQEKISKKINEKNNSSLPPKAKGSSIVHLDIVKRNKKDYRLIFPVEDITSPPNQHSQNITAESKESSNHSTNAMNSDNESDNDEDIAITHSERLRMMSSAATNATSSLLKTRQNVLLKLQSKPVKIDELERDDDEEDLEESYKNGAKMKISPVDEEEPSRLFHKTSMTDLLPSNTHASKVKITFRNSFMS
jgi:hypothetical protein